MHKITTLMVTAGFIALSLVAVAPGASAAVATFSLTDDAHDDAGIQNEKGMDAGAGTYDAVGTASLASGAGQIWVADLPVVAPHDVTGDWTISFDGCSTGGGGFTAEVGSWSATTNTFTSLGADATADCNGASISVTGSIITNQFAAVRITDFPEPGPIPGDTATVFNLGPGSTTVSTPDLTPGYPTPSIATILLLSAGILMVAGVVYKRRKSE